MSERDARGPEEHERPCFGGELQRADASPHGPIAFALLIVSAAWLWSATRRRVTSRPTG